MILVFGGAYQGKLEYALKKFNLNESDVYRCVRNDQNPDFSKPIVYGLEEFVYNCCVNNLEASAVLASKFKDISSAPTIFVASDVSQGLVPMDATDRAFREMMGRTMLMLAREADEVHRIFCGLGQRLK